MNKVLFDIRMHPGLFDTEFTRYKSVLSNLFLIQIHFLCHCNKILLKVAVSEYSRYLNMKELVELKLACSLPHAYKACAQKVNVFWLCCVSVHVTVMCTYVCVLYCVFMQAYVHKYIVYMGIVLCMYVYVHTYISTCICTYICYDTPSVCMVIFNLDNFPMSMLK